MTIRQNQQAIILRVCVYFSMYICDRLKEWDLKCQGFFLQKKKTKKKKNTNILSAVTKKKNKNFDCCSSDWYSFYLLFLYLFRFYLRKCCSYYPQTAVQNHCCLELFHSMVAGWEIKTVQLQTSITHLWPKTATLSGSALKLLFITSGSWNNNNNKKMLYLSTVYSN